MIYHILSPPHINIVHVVPPNWAYNIPWGWKNSRGEELSLPPHAMALIQIRSLQHFEYLFTAAAI